MKFSKFVTSFLRVVLLSIGLILIITRLFFAKQMENSVITPLRRMPVFGQVLGMTWDVAGEAGSTVTDKTIEFVNNVEKTDLPLNESILKIAENKNPGKAASDLVNQEVDKEIQDFKNLPKEAINRAKEELRKEMYKQICKQWLEPSPASTPSASPR